MKYGKILALSLVVGATVSVAHAQVYSQNIVGYINQPFYVGDNFIANQLGASDNTLNTIFTPGTVPEGATFTEWNPATQQYLPTSTYDTVNGWSINYALTYGQGGLLYSPAAFNNTFTGEVWPDFNPNATFVPPQVTGAGSLLLSCVIPINDATFYDVVGRDPRNGESVTLLDAATQTYTTTTFEDGAWNNGDPALNVGESAMFDLESYIVAEVPEPAACTVLATGLAMVIAARITAKKRAQPKTL